MKIKSKLTSAIMSFVLVLSLLSVGVYALNQAEVILGGNLTFSATGVYAEVRGSVANAVMPEGQDKDYAPLLFSTDNTEPNQTSWQKTLGFDGTNDIVLTINIENKANDRKLYVAITDTADEVANVTKTVKQGENDCLNTCIEVEAGDTAEIKITFHLENVNLSLAEQSLYGYKIQLSDTEIVFEEPVVMNYDAENNYYYIEMGTYNGQPVRWRYVSDTTNGIANAQRFAPTAENKPNTASGSQGMFVLESDIITVSDINATEEINDDGILPFLQSGLFDTSTGKHTTTGHTDVNANDYATSDVRAFLNGSNNVAGNSVGNIMDVISIDSTNAIYQKIQARSLTDLYTKAGASVSSNIYTPVDVIVPTQYESTKDSATDKFWIPSQLETYTIIGGNLLNTDGAMDMLNCDKTNIIWHSPAHLEYSKDMWNTDCACYWLRSFLLLDSVSSIGTVGNIGYAGVDGLLCSGGVDSIYCAVRACFILAF